MGSSLYDRLGGASAIAAVVEDFVARCAGDERINKKFARTDIPRLKQMLADQVSEAAGGPATYAGRDMKETHRKMGVTAGEFDASFRHPPALHRLVWRLSRTAPTAPVSSSVESLTGEPLPRHAWPHDGLLPSSSPHVP
jgi:globin